MPEVGTTLSYAIRGGFEGTLDLQLVRWVGLGGEHFDGYWTSALSGRALPEPLTAEHRARCGPDALEESWNTSNLMAPLIGTRAPTWRWPGRLRDRLEFGGTVEVLVGGRARGRVERAHRVRGRERVTVPAGDFDAWAVDVSDMSGDAVTTSRVWVAESLGLVRSVQQLLPAEVVYELAAVTPPPGPQ